MHVMGVLLATGVTNVCAVNVNANTGVPDYTSAYMMIMAIHTS